MDAMAVRRAHLRPSQLWQLPLLGASIALFGYAGYLFIDPKPRTTLPQKIATAQDYLKRDHPEDVEQAITLLNRLVQSNQLSSADEGRVRLLLAESLEKGQKLLHLNIESNYKNIIDQTLAAVKLGAPATGDAYRRLGESYEALGQPTAAMESYQTALNLDRGAAPLLARKVIALQMAGGEQASAERSIDQYLQGKALADADRAWALDQKAQLLAQRGQVSEAAALLDESSKLDARPASQGVVRYYQGYCAWKLKQNAQAERLLRLSRDLLKSGNELDAEAAYLLGRIAQENDKPRQAISFYQQVLFDHPESHPAPQARLGRGQCRIALGETEAGLADLHDLVSFISAKPSRSAYAPDAIAGLRQATAMLVARQELTGALETLADEQTLNPQPAPEFFGRLASVYEARADQLEKEPDQRARRDAKPSFAEQVVAMRTRAGDAYVALSRKLVLADDRGSGDAMWHAVDLYDRAGATPQVVAALEEYAAQRPDDGQTPDALLRLGRADQANGQFDKAIEAFLRNQFRYPQSLAASKSGVPLAQCYIAQGQQFYGKAEKVLLAVVDNNPVLTPQAEEFRQALFELAQLYYRTDRYEEAVVRLEEMTQRYAADTNSGQIAFLMADSYRKSAGLLKQSLQAPATQPLGGQTASATTAPTPAELAAQGAEAAAARIDRLQKSRGLFDHCIDLYQQSAPTTPTDQLYQKLAWFYRGDCAFDLGSYDQAINLYTAATLRYQDDPDSLAGYVQVVNAYIALGKPQEARAANERAKWMLRNMPPQAFDPQKSSLSKQYWDQWLQQTGDSGLWASAARKQATGN
jgi:TolA-binding protein